MQRLSSKTNSLSIFGGLVLYNTIDNVQLHTLWFFSADSDIYLTVCL